jgi:hypothetical protein
VLRPPRIVRSDGDTAAAHTFTTVHSFNGTDGASPTAGLIQATDGNLYETTPGEENCPSITVCGTVFKVSPYGGTLTIYSFPNTKAPVRNWSKPTTATSTERPGAAGSPAQCSGSRRVAR